jgi:hypothetical protein
MSQSLISYVYEIPVSSVKSQAYSLYVCSRTVAISGNTTTVKYNKLILKPVVYLFRDLKVLKVTRNPFTFVNIYYTIMLVIPTASRVKFQLSNASLVVELSKNIISRTAIKWDAHRRYRRVFLINGICKKRCINFRTIC